MSSAESKISFRATLMRPVEVSKGATWAFLILPKAASAKLPTRSQTSVQGTLNGAPFKATLEPDGEKSHWLKVTRKLREAAGASPGEVVTVELAPMDEEPEPKVPPDLKRALASSPKARELWLAITPIARRDWVHWVVSAKQAETRSRRVANACSMLEAGKKRVCCFDRSGFFSKAFRPPEAAPEVGRPPKTPGR